ncbi:hypothetical protein ADIAG_02393 [Paeniglutamicibacter gangotriensis Lz1y]|uniref:Uncharacterized protein n=1 Tax=Paeniglutamicibacter gangotriensis Lz1y TaxID=1276920 RepID=M7N9B3_9MICC|nr:hypothetical protein ADIAG_02393 [Paeniglutamicibacter gangotriensis Lz1y]
MNSNYACATEQGYLNHVRRNDAPCMTCKAWKKKNDAGEAAKAAPVRSKAQVAECGTVSGYRKHRRNSEAACAPCREEANRVSRENKAKKRTVRVAGGPKPAPQEPKEPRTIKHGTTAGYQAHKRRDEQPCEPCLAALREKSRKARADAPKKPRVRKLLPCGTAAAYLRHLRDNEEACPPCKEAQRLDSVAKRARKIAREGGPRPHAGRKPITHGTIAGRAQHVRRGEMPCDPCRIAFNEYNRQYSASRRKAA